MLLIAYDIWPPSFWGHATSSGEIASTWFLRPRYSSLGSHIKGRTISTCRRRQQEQHTASSNTRLGNGCNGTASRTEDRELILSVLNASTTKRDARSYLSRFNIKNKRDRATDADTEPLHLALVILRDPQELSQLLLNGVAQTLSQLAQLGLHSVVVLDHSKTAIKGSRESTTYATQCDRMVTALQSGGGTKARRLDFVFGTTAASQDGLTSAKKDGRVEVQFGDILLKTLRQGIIPVIPPLAFSVSNQQAVQVRADDVLLALVKNIVGLPSATNVNGSDLHEGVDQSIRRPPSCEIHRIIILDSIGGLPSSSRSDKAHVFVNLEQEFEGIMTDLKSIMLDQEVTSERPLGQGKRPSLFGRSNPLSSLLEDEMVSTQYHQEGAAHPKKSLDITTSSHLRNLRLAQHCLSLLPPSSSGLLTTPQAAATLSQVDAPQNVDLGVVTRRPKNPLIFNLLTDKPTVSSSLPVARVRSDGPNERSSTSPTVPATFFKRGMPVTMIPNSRVEKWQPPGPTNKPISLDDPRIDFGRLLTLIEDSFSRPLDVEDYVSRIRDRVAGIIVAGEYEGGAILTWELPPGVPDDGSEESCGRMVPYLDKFAVRKRSQGAGGVADIVFSAMVRTCFPDGVCWRSRKNNPVNKWYFERSSGSLKLQDSPWSMFWTTPDLVDNEQKFLDYENVCRHVKPSWADKKHIVD